MTLPRHASGEDAQTPRYLHTLHGVGYRFDLPAVDPAAAAPAASAAADAEVERVAVEPGAAGTAERGWGRWTRIAGLALLRAAIGVGWRAFLRHDAHRLLRPWPRRR